MRPFIRPFLLTNAAFQVACCGLGSSLVLTARHACGLEMDPLNHSMFGQFASKHKKTEQTTDQTTE
jgi:hypothetical protein